MSQQYFIEGLDPTALACLTKADILQMIHAAKPYTAFGMLIFAVNAPDVVVNPEQKYFLWIKVVDLINYVPTGDIYYYNGTSWTLWILLDGSKLTDNTVPLSKIKRVGTAAYDIIQVNSTNNGLIYTSIVNAIQAASITLAKIANGGAGNFVFASIGGTNQFYTPAQLVALFGSAAFNLTQIANGGIGNDYFLMSISGINTFVLAANLVNYIEDNTINKSKLLHTGGSAGQSIRINSAGNGWEFYTPGVSSAFSAHKNGTNQTILNNTATKVTFGTEVYDTAGYYTVASSTFTAGIAGIYRFNAMVTFESAGGAAVNQFTLRLYKNGVLFKEVYAGMIVPATIFNSLAIAADMQLALNDTVEVYVNQQSGVSMNINGLASATYFNGSQIQ